jgi:hypothetical protein
MSDQSILYDEELYLLLVDFIKSIGIDIKEDKIDQETFIPGILPLSAGLIIDKDKLKHSGDLLHEAGHIAVTEESLRSQIGSDKVNENWPNDGDEIAANLWSYAVIVYLKIPIESVFHLEAYKLEAEWFIQNFTTGNYIGLPLLQWMGFCHKDKDVDENHAGFPHMLKWLR